MMSQKYEAGRASGDMAGRHERVLYGRLSRTKITGGRKRDCNNPGESVIAHTDVLRFSGEWTGALTAPGTNGFWAPRRPPVPPHFGLHFNQQHGHTPTHMFLSRSPVPKPLMHQFWSTPLHQEPQGAFPTPATRRMFRPPYQKRRQTLFLGFLFLRVYWKRPNNHPC